VSNIGYAAVLALLALCACAASAQEYEALPYGDLEYMAGAGDGTQAWCVWARAGKPPLAIVGWSVGKDNPASGNACVKAEGAKGPVEEFLIAGEGSGGEIVGTIKLRGEEEGAQAKVRLSWFNRLTRVDETKTFDLTGDWQTYELSTRADVGGPLELAVIPVGEATIYADDFSIRCAGPPPNENVADPTPVGHDPVTLLPLQEYTGEAKGREGSVELRVSFPTEDEPIVPYVWGGIPFPKGEVYDRRCLRVVDAQGNAVPAQFDVLSRWHGDASIQALLVTVPAGQEHGLAQRLRLDYASRRAPGAGRSEAMRGPSSEWRERIEPVVVDLEGREVEREDLQWEVTEREGPLCRVMCKRQRLGPLTVENRLTAFAGSSRVLISTCFINEGERCVVRDLGLRLIWPGEGFVSVTRGRKTKDLTKGGGTGGTGGVATLQGPETVVGVAIRDSHENRATFSARREAATAWSWWQEYRVAGVVLSQGLARTFEVMIDFDNQGQVPQYSTRKLPLLTAPAEWYCNSGVFNFLMPPDPETFPIFESTLGSLQTLGRFSWEQKDSRELYGWFNFGDAPGDGGWSNLETMADHEIFLHFFRTLSREHYENALLAAEHYRDVDIDHRFGYCHTHCNNHTSSGESWSHSWIQGIRDLFFLTGDGRSLAVLREVGERLLSKEPGFTTGRDWTRAIDNLVDIYQATGDELYLSAALEHIRVLGERQEPETSVCGGESGSWYHNRYEAGSAFSWYGCLAMAKLHANVGGDELREVFLRELDLSLDVERKGKAAYVYLPDESVSEDKRAEVIGRYTLGRGSVLFPALGYAYRLTGDEKYLRIGLDVLAYCLLNQRGSSDASATSFITAFLREARSAGWGAEQEAEAFARAREFSWAQHPREVANGGFEMDSFRHWSVKKVPGQDFYEDPIVHVSYHLDEQVKLEGRRALRIHSDNRGRVISVAGKVALAGGRRWRLSGWVRSDETMNPTMSYGLRNYDTNRRSGGSLIATGAVRDGWQERAAEFMSLGNMVLTVTVGNRRGTGDVWFDEIGLEELGALRKLLTDNGVGHEGREPPQELIIPTGGTYLPDAPMTGDVESDGPIRFSEGALTDGDDGYDYHRKPCSYAYWQDRPQGELLFDLGAEYEIDRVALKVNCDPSRRAHGTAKIELLAAEGEEPIAVIEAPVDGWNSFDDLELTAQKLRLRLDKMEGRTYLTIAEVQIWGDAAE